MSELNSCTDAAIGAALAVLRENVTVRELLLRKASADDWTREERCEVADIRAVIRGLGEVLEARRTAVRS